MTPDGTVEFAQHMLASGRDLDAIELAREVLLAEPEDEDEDAQDVCGWALEGLHRRLGAGEKLGRAERAELDRFADRGGLYALRDAMRVLVEERRPELQVLLAGGVRDWIAHLEEAEGGESENDFALEPDEDGARSKALFRLAMEHAWLLDGDADEDWGTGTRSRPRLGSSSRARRLRCSRPTRTFPRRSRARRASGWAP
ncbi:MAG: hypothetical protein M3071_19420 [Actinomycetota bacterium]|nr:hypothetical protein [Actinomycetota bacterium]